MHPCNWCYPWSNTLCIDCPGIILTTTSRFQIRRQHDLGSQLIAASFLLLLRELGHPQNSLGFRRSETLVEIFDGNSRQLHKPIAKLPCFGRFLALTAMEMNG